MKSYFDFFVFFGVCIAYSFSIYGFLSFFYHLAVDRNKRFSEADKEEWFKKGFISGCADALDEVIKLRFEVEKEKEQSKALLGMKHGSTPAYVLVEQPDGSTVWQAKKENGK